MKGKTGGDGRKIEVCVAIIALRLAALKTDRECYSGDSNHRVSRRLLVSTPEEPSGVDNELSRPL